jgi:hypothetical protein
MHGAGDLLGMSGIRSLTFLDDVDIGLQSPD